MAYELFFDGFESYASTAEMLKQGYTQANGSLSSSGRRSGKAFSGITNSGQGLMPVISPSTHIVCGAAFYVSTALTFALTNSGTGHAVLTVTPQGQLSLAVGGVTVAASSSTFPINTWMFIELGLSVANAGGTYEVRVNGSSVGWIPAGSGDTQNGAATTVNRIQITSNQGVGTFYLVDDLYITYGNELIWLGDSRVDRLLLTANTATQGWTPSTGNAWERLNAGDGYVESATDEATSLFEVADLNYSPLGIYGVKTAGLIKKSDAGYREACLLSKSGATTVESAAVALSTDTLGFTQILKTDPATGAAWGLPAVQAFQPGLRVKV